MGTECTVIYRLGDNYFIKHCISQTAITSTKPEDFNLHEDAEILFSFAKFQAIATVKQGELLNAIPS